MQEIKYKSRYYKIRREKDFLIVSNQRLEVFFLDEISSNIFDAFNNGEYIEQVVSVLISQYGYDVKKKDLYRDVEGFVVELLEKDLLEEVC